MSHLFKVGQKVVCVNDASKDGGWVYLESDEQCEHPPVLGKVYTIAEMQLEHSMLWLIFEESPSLESFDARCFRPLEKRKTDISIFKAMLSPSHQKVDA